jgi:hypothetical protein
MERARVIVISRTRGVTKDFHHHRLTTTTRIAVVFQRLMTRRSFAPKGFKPGAKFC